MFESKVRSINITQFEHARFAGILAEAWGNEAFDKPAINFDSFLNGVVFHDWHYGLIDTLSLSDYKIEEWMTMAEKGATIWFDDPIVDIVSKLHLKRLLGNKAIVSKLIGQVDQRISKRLSETKHTLEQFMWADKITCFCDYLAFDFSFEKPLKDSLVVHPKVSTSQETSITYSIEKNNIVVVNPWPFNQSVLSGIMVAYQRTGYPEKLQPIAIQYKVLPM